MIELVSSVLVLALALSLCGRNQRCSDPSRPLLIVFHI